MPRVSILLQNDNRLEFFAMAYHRYKDEAPLLTSIQVAVLFIGFAFMLLGLIFDPLLDTNYLVLIGCLLELFFLLFFICIIVFMLIKREKLSLFIYSVIFCMAVYFFLVPHNSITLKVTPAENPTISGSQNETNISYFYVGSINSDKFHLPSCRHAKSIHDENLIRYDSAKDAEKDGRTPCSICLGK